MNNVGEKVVVPEPVVDVDLLVVDRQRSGVDAPLLSQQKVSFRDFRPVRLLACVYVGGRFLTRSALIGSVTSL